MHWFVSCATFDCLFIDLFVYCDCHYCLIDNSDIAYKWVCIKDNVYLFFVCFVYIADGGTNLFDFIQCKNKRLRVADLYTDVAFRIPAFYYQLAFIALYNLFNCGLNLISNLINNW